MKLTAIHFKLFNAIDMKVGKVWDDNAYTDTVEPINKKISFNKHNRIINLERDNGAWVEKGVPSASKSMYLDRSMYSLRHYKTTPINDLTYDAGGNIDQKLQMKGIYVNLFS